MTTEPLNPAVQPRFQARYAENTAGIIAAITACIDALGGEVTSYPSNTGGIIQALIDLQAALGGTGTATTGIAVTLPVTAGESISKGQALYIATDGLAYVASNVFARQNATVLGFAKTAATTGQAFICVARGRIEGLTGLAPGLQYYLTLSGGITPTAPTGGGMYLVSVGQALSTTALDVDPQPPVLLV